MRKVVFLPNQAIVAVRSPWPGRTPVLLSPGDTWAKGNSDARPLQPTAQDGQSLTTAESFFFSYPHCNLGPTEKVTWDVHPDPLCPLLSRCRR